MSLPIPLTAVLHSSRANRSVSAEVRDLQFRWSVPGGYGPCTIDLARPLYVQPSELDYYSTLTVYDSRNAQVVYAGRIEDLGRSSGPDGAIWQVAAVGPSAHTQDDTRPLIYNDRRLDAWHKATGVTQEAQTAQTHIGEDAGGSGADAIILTMQSGLPITSGEGSTAEYRGLVDSAGQKLAIMGYVHDSKFASTIWKVRGFSSISTVWRDNNMATSISPTDYGFIGTDWVAGEARPFLKIVWTGGASTTSETWTSFMDVVIVATRFLKDGTEKLSGYASATDAVGILASEVVADLLGRMLPQFDGANAEVTATSYRIDQLAYPDGVSPRQVLDDMMEIETDFYWAAWEKTSSGKHRFEWVKWPTTVRYEADAEVDQLNSPSSAAELYNKVNVRYRDTRGIIRQITRTTTVASLDDAGLTRTHFIDLGDELGSAANATRIGDQFLAEHAAPPNAGQLVVSRPLLDLKTGRMVQPWEIRPGLIRVRGIQPAGAGQSGRDGYTVFRVVGADYRASDNSVQLELDSRSRTTAQLVAALLRRQKKRRR